MPTISAVGKRRPHVDDDDAGRRTRRPSCSCRSRPARRAGGRAASRSRRLRARGLQQAVALEHARTRPCSSSSASTSGRRRPPAAMAEQVQRGLDAGSGCVVTTSASIDVAQRRVDLGAALGLVDHAAHLLADDVARDAGCRRRRRCRACARGCRRCRRRARGRRSSARFVVVGLLDAVDARRSARARRAGRSACRAPCGPGCCRAGSAGRWRAATSSIVARAARGGWAGCSTA